MFVPVTKDDLASLKTESHLLVLSLNMKLTAIVVIIQLLDWTVSECRAYFLHPVLNAECRMSGLVLEIYQSFKSSCCLLYPTVILHSLIKSVNFQV